MEYVQLGKSGLRVSKIILGCMSYGSSQWQDWVLDEEESVKMLKAAYDAGINTWDTANTYSNGESERVIGRAIKKYNIPRRELVIMTKCFSVVGPEPSTKVPGPLSADAQKDLHYVNNHGLSRQAIFNAVDESLERLQLSYIDLLWIHRHDPTVPKEETMRALHDLVCSGKVRYIGASSMWAWQFAQYQHVADKYGWTQFVAMQNAHSLAYREEEREVIPYCKNTGVGVTPWYPLHAGKLCRPLSQSSSTTRGNFKGRTNLVSFKDSSDAEATIINRVEEIAKKRGWSMAQVAIAWSASKVTAPIVGISKVERLEELVKGVGYKLDPEEVKYLEEPYTPQKVMGHA